MTGFHPQMPALLSVIAHCSERTVTIDYDDADPISQPGLHTDMPVDS